MGIILLVLLLAVIFGGLGFAIHILWWIALVVLVLWLIGFVARFAALPGGLSGQCGAVSPGRRARLR